MRLFKNKLGYTILELMIALGLLGAVSIGTGAYLSNSFRDSNNLASKAEIQTSVSALMNKLDMSIKTADVPIFKGEVANNNFTINNNQEGKSIKFIHDAENEKITTYIEGIEETTYYYIKSIKIKPEGKTGANITIIGSEDKYSVSGTYYSRNTVPSGNNSSSDKSVCIILDPNGVDAEQIVLDVSTVYINLPGNSFPPPENKVFAGWAEESKGEILSNPYFIDTNVEKKVLYAIWETDYKNISLTYDCKEGKINGERYLHGQVYSNVDPEEGYDISITTKTPVREGYTFSHWTDADGNVYTYMHSINIKVNTTLYANYIAKQYNVVLDNQEATYAGTKNVTVTYDSAMPAITKPQREYTVTYNYNGGSGSISEDTGKYSFSGYYTLENGKGTKYYTESGTSARHWDQANDDILYAYWTDGDITLPNASRDGYTFGGWYSGSTKIGDAEEEYYPISDIKLTAKWTANTYTVKYDANKPSVAKTEVTGKTADSTHTYDVSKNLTTNGYSLTDWTFKGWSTTSSGSVVYTDGQSVKNLTSKVNGVVTLYAVWGCNHPTTTLTYSPNICSTLDWGYYTYIDGHNTIATCNTCSQIVSNVKTTCTFEEVNVPYVNGQHLEKYQCKYCQGLLNVTIEECTDSGSGKCSVCGQSLYYFTVKFNGNNGKFANGNASMQEKFMVIGNYPNEKVTVKVVSNIPTRTGYIFKGWGHGNTIYHNSGDSYEVKSEDFGVTLVGYTDVINAIWSANEYTVTLADDSGTRSIKVTYDNPMPSITKPTKQYTVTYDYNGGSGSPATSTSTYDFGGYYTETDGKGIQYYTSSCASARNWDQTSGDALYPKWTSKSVTLPTPTRSGYTFNGWYNGNAKIGNGGITYTPTSNITLTASWTANGYTITLDGQGATTAGTTSITATYGSAMPSITKPARVYTVTYNYNGGSGSPSTATSTYTFGGYYTEKNGGGTQYYTSTGASARNWDQASGDILYAKWTSKSVILPTPTRTGYTFNGWSDGTNTYSAGAAYTPLKSITLTATWSCNHVDVATTYLKNDLDNDEYTYSDNEGHYTVKTCRVCGLEVSRTLVKCEFEIVYKQYSSSQHRTDSECKYCGGYLNRAIENHEYLNGKCTKCEYGCVHSATTTTHSKNDTNGDGYTYLESEGHYVIKTCVACGKQVSKTQESCSFETVYKQYSSSQHRTDSECKYCGGYLNGAIENHEYSNGTCIKCEYGCTHSSTSITYVKNDTNGDEYTFNSSEGHYVIKTCIACGKQVSKTQEGCSFEIVYKQYSSSQHRTDSECKHCGGYLNRAIENHEYSNGICTKCEYGCAHSSTSTSYVKNDTNGDGYTYVESEGHYIVKTCKLCNKEISRTKATCTFTKYIYSQYDSSQHKYDTACTYCGGYLNKGSYESHSYSNGTCTKCSYTCAHSSTSTTYVKNDTNGDGYTYVESEGHYIVKTCATCNKETSRTKATCTFTKYIYSQYSSSQHKYDTACTYCGGYLNKGSYESHSYSNGTCTKCSYTCAHSSTSTTYVKNDTNGDGYTYVESEGHYIVKTCTTCNKETSRTQTTCTFTKYTYSQYTSSQHKYDTSCITCGGYLNKGSTESHSYSNGTCTKCSYVCTHPSTSTTYPKNDTNGDGYTYSSSEGHYTVKTCTTCGKQTSKTRTTCTFTKYTYSQYTSSQHKYDISCITCGGYLNKGSTESHSYSNGTCTKCSYVCTHPSTSTTYPKNDTNGDGYTYSSSEGHYTVKTCTTCNKETSRTQTTCTFTKYTYSQYTSSQHKYDTSCITCGGYLNKGSTESHSYSNGTCTKCSYVCTHPSTSTTYPKNDTNGDGYTYSSSEGHYTVKTCTTCNKETSRTQTTCTFTKYTYSQYTSSQHKYDTSCITCGGYLNKGSTESHSYSNGTCTKCSYVCTHPSTSTTYPKNDTNGDGYTISSSEGHYVVKTCTTCNKETSRTRETCTFTKYIYHQDSSSQHRYDTACTYCGGYVNKGSPESHSYSNGTCTKCWYVCSHSWSQIGTTTSNCVKTINYKCSMCSNTKAESTTYHTYNNNSWYYGGGSYTGNTCQKNCDCGAETNYTAHGYNTTVTKEATCTTSGTRAYDCRYCDAYYTESIPVIAHTPGEAIYTSNGNATHTVHFPCTKCGYKGTGSVTDCGFTNGKCWCGYTCPHNLGTQTYTPNGDGTHKVTFPCTICDYESISNDSCQFTNSKCWCGYTCTSHNLGTQIYTSNGNGTHKVTFPCTICDYESISNDSCQLTNGKCWCGYECSHSSKTEKYVPSSEEGKHFGYVPVCDACGYYDVSSYPLSWATSCWSNPCSGCGQSWTCIHENMEDVYVKVGTGTHQFVSQCTSCGYYDDSSCKPEYASTCWSNPCSGCGQSW